MPANMIALPDFTAGAMENWGLITYRESALLYKDGVSSESQKQRVCTIIAHELAHQWFGNLVTMKWWDHLWLNEGFASYVEYVGTVAVEPDWRMWDKFILYDLHRAMATDALVTSRPIITEVLTPSEINSMFDRISYQKGSSVLRMMNHFLGESTFTKGLKYYVEALQYGSAENSDLWFHLDKAIQKDNIDLGGLNLATIMDTWTLQMGFPFIKVERTYNGARQITARVEQQRFLSDPDSDPSTDHPDLGYKWYVPVTYTTASSPDFDSPRSMWLKPQDEFGTLQLSGGSDDDWLLVNINQRGMYRVNYDDKNWQLIKMQLESVHTAIPTASRAALISDVFSLAMAREISHRTALDITSYLKEERDYVPWYAVDSALGYIERNIRRKGAFGNFQKYMREQITPMYEYTGWKNEGDHLKSLSRGRAINMACRYGNEDCVQTSVNLYAQWMNNIGQNLIPGIHPDMQATAFCTAIAEGDQNEWYFAFERYQNPNTSTSVKSALLTAMACSKKPWILSTYLKSSLDSSIIRSQDREDVVTAVAGNPVGLPLAWDFFRANWDFFREEYGDTVFLLDSLISGITSNFNTEFELQMLKQFMEDHPDQGTGARAFAEAVAVIEANIRWVEQFYDEVEGWLTETVNTPKVWEEIRLPLSLIPEHYDLTIRTDLTEFVFNGTVDILFECKEKTSIVLLHSKSLNFTEGVTEITRINDGPTPTRTKEPWIYEPHDFVVVELNSYLTVGEKYNLHMEFQGPLEADLRGYYRMSYTTKAGEEKFLASTFFDPVDARKAFPCFDEPDLKATFSIILEHQPRYHALANMPKSLPDKVLEDGWVRATFEKSVIMSTYLVCYVVSEFVSVNMTTEHGVSFAVWTQEDFIDQADYALQVGADILDHYDHLYGMDIKYPLPKMDMIALLDFTAGAMENWGLITYRESALLYKDGVSSESQKQRVCTIVAHELAHQWFGNLVTMKWWDYIWLNEGFASYVEYVGTEQVEPDFEIWDKFVVYDLQRSMATDALITSRPIVIPVSTPSEINSMFDTISYNKGASILRMMRYFLGESTFTKGLKYYLKDRQNNTAENSDLWRNLQRAVKEDNVDFGSGLTVETIMRTWTRQMGFPTVTVTRLYGGEANKIKAMATQKRFLTDPASDTGSSAYPDLGYKWYVPLTYTTGQNPDFDTPSAMWLLTTENANIETAGDDSDWLLVNTNERGFYRVNYDETNWKLLSRQLMNNHTMISTTSRSALISDAFSLARAGDLSQAKALDLTSYLREERDYVPWYTVDSVLGYIYDNLALTAANASYETYMRAQIEPMYQYVGWANTGNHLQKLSRARAINMACGYGLEDCRTEASTRYADWMTDMITNKVEADLQYIVFCTGIADGGETEWQFAFDLYTNGNTDTSLKSNLQSAMACSKDINILSRYLAAVLNTSQIREQDGKDVVVAVASNPAGTNLAWDFFRNNWAYFRKAYGNTVFLFDSLIKGVTTHFNTLESLKEVEQFMEAHPDQGTGAWAFIQSVAEIKANIRWMEENFVEVTEWLDNASKEPWERIRLPDAILPISYDLKVRTDLTNFAFNGSVDILIECFEKTDVILVHNRNLTIPDGTTTLTREDGGTAPGYKVEPWLYAETEFIVIQLDALLEVGAKYRLHIEFNNALRNDLGGYYLSSYNPKSGGTRYLASTFFDPVDARKAFPCFDEPDMKATFNITLEYEPQYHALANMPMKGSPETLDGGWMRATFEESVIMSTYLVCYIVSDFKAKFMTTQNDVEFGVWAQEDFINQTDYALQRGVEILDYFDGLYGLEIKYPLTKLDMIALPDFSAGAMENWGLITYREARLLYEEGVSSESRKQSVCTVIAHELAHQWFGNLVTTKWWDYLWLNEGFASWVEYIGTHQVEGDDWAMWDKFVIYDLNRAMGVDALTTSRPIVAKTLTTSEINEMFDTITYNKGASVLRMANDFIGEDTFLKGLKSYLRGLQYRGAENSDLWYHVNKAMMEDGVDLGDGITDIATVMDTWTNQMGFPVVMVTRTYSGETNKITASATQKRFLTDPSSDTTSPYPDLGYVWHVPLTYTSGVNPNFANPEIQWMRPEDQITDVILDGAGGDDNWLLVNVNERGFYSVNYDERNWALLSAQLQTNHMAISIPSRSALIYDAFNLARAGDLSQTKALDLTSYLDKEQDYVPWYTVDRVMDYIGDNLALEDANEDFIEYMRKKVTPMYNYVGWNDEEDHLKRLSRSRAISMACGYGNTDCINKAKEMYANWMDNTTNTVIEANLQSTVFCTAISEGGQSEWDAAFAAYTDSTTISSLKDVLESAMACSKDKAVLQMYLSKVLDTALIRSQDGQSVVSAVASNPAGRALAWNFFVENWSFFRETYGNGVFLLDNVVTAVTNDFNTQAELDQVKQFMADNPDQGTGSRAFTKAVAVINANIRWMDQNYEEVAKWLRLNA
ncbi:putative aminopeptidase-2 isoform X2 [Acanthaster planci]|uniref:Aminopeptidase-2 isoform X2 n=1 Tax=Acanthaster planci TaxID=133434 RepID=A0A8B7XM05_ACAPL|nr:putative aminopeptidase-2 isoform X2 [Acanthaster planci]